MMQFFTRLPKRSILNFLTWFIANLVLFYALEGKEILYHFSLIGIPVVMVVVYFFSIYKRRYIIPALLGLATSVALTMWVL